MLIVETIAKIRRAYFGQGKSIKLICREFRVSRKAVRKVIRSGATEFRYERSSQPLPKIGPWKAELDRLLTANEGRPRRERLTLIRLFEEIRARGHFPNDDAATKLLYLVLNRAAEDWKRPPREWCEAKTQFAVMFGERFVNG